MSSIKFMHQNFFYLFPGFYLRTDRHHTRHMLLQFSCGYFRQFFIQFILGNYLCCNNYDVRCFYHCYICSITFCIILYKIYLFHQTYHNNLGSIKVMDLRQVNDYPWSKLLKITQEIKSVLDYFIEYLFHFS